MARVVVDVMPKPEILDPQGKAVTGALARLGFAGMSVRQGKRFEIELEGEVSADRMDEVASESDTDRSWWAATAAARLRAALPARS